MKQQMRKILKTKWFWIVLSLLIVIRMASPFFILQKLNKFLGDFSPEYAVHIDDLDLQIFRGAYRFTGVTAFLKHKNQIFLKAELIDVSLAWRELIHGQVRADALGENVDFVWTPEFNAAVLSAPKQSIQDADTVKKKLFPFRITRIDVRNSSFQYADLPNLPDIQRWKVTDLNGRLSNVLPTETNPISLFTAKGTLLGSSTMNVIGRLNRVAKPIRWDVDVELKEFDLVKGNSLLKRKLPLTFTSGTLDIYAEARSEEGKIEGSVKPFLKKVDVVEKDEHFLGLKHFGIEIGVAALNLILRNTRDHAVATKILFSYDNKVGKFELNSQKALSEAIAHGFQDKINPGIENEYKFSNLELTKKASQ